MGDGNGNKAEARTSRVLSTYHLFRYCAEVEVNTLTRAFSISPKTAQRDIALLERAGVLRAEFDRTCAAYIPVSLEIEPMAEEQNATRRKYMEKLRRICRFMAALEDCVGSPIALYRSLFPALTDRTRQRDFAQLSTLGYVLHYSGAFAGEPGGWVVEIPPAFGLDTIPKDTKWW